MSIFQGNNYFDLIGSVRTVLPSLSCQRIIPQFHHFGITRLAELTYLDNIGIPVYACIRPNAKTLSVFSR